MAQDIKEKYINPYTDFGFKKLFGTEMYKDLRRGYEDSVKAYRDINNAINTAKKDARQEEKVNTALKMKADGMSAELIAKYTSLSIDEIENL